MFNVTFFTTVKRTELGYVLGFALYKSYVLLLLLLNSQVPDIRADNNQLFIQLYYI